MQTRRKTEYGVNKREESIVTVTISEFPSKSGGTFLIYPIPLIKKTVRE